MTVVELHDISYVRGGVTILTAVDWRVESGEHWAILGANGSGKTTLLKVVTGYEWPTQGAVRVLGETFGGCDLRELRKRVGWVSSFLEHRFPAHDSALEVAVSGFEASIGLYVEVTDEQRRLALEALLHVGADELAARPYRLLSQGEQQRVLIARALVNDPAMVILDEPCAGLDPLARENLLSDLGRFASRGGTPTLVLVTHHIEEIGPWITHVLVMKQGRALAQGPTSHILTPEILSEAFGAPCDVRQTDGCYTFRLTPLDRPPGGREHTDVVES